MQPDKETKDNAPLLTVVIATRNRIPYAISTIESILGIPDPGLELVVQDNSDTRDLETHVRAHIRDSRFHYRYTPPPFSSIDNFNAAMEMASGEYVCMIGDDDGINPELLEAARWARNHDWDAVTSRNIVNYLWHRTGIASTLFTQVKEGSLTLLDFSGKVFETDAPAQVERLVRNGGVYYLHFPLPKIYHGLVRRRCMETIREKTGAYFGGLSPDIFAAITISLVARRVVFVDYPLTIPGACAISASADNIKGKHRGRLEDAPHFRDRGEYRWCELVPRVYSVETIWADSAVAALRAMNREDLVRRLNLPRLAAYCIAANRELAGPVMRDFFRGLRLMNRNRALGAIRFAAAMLWGPGIKQARRVWNRFLLMIGTRRLHTIVGLDGMVEASRALSGHLEAIGRSFSQCIRQDEKREPLKNAQGEPNER